MNNLPRLLFRTCGTTISEEKLLAQEAHFRANKVSKEIKSNATATATVNLYWHVVTQVCVFLMIHSIGRAAKAIPRTPL